MIKIAVFASGEGTNLQALLDAAASRRIRGTISFVVSSREDAGALARAKRAGVEVIVLRPKDHPGPQEYSAALAAECRRRDIGLICLAGFMHKLAQPLLEAFPGRILNIHPALLPAFGGQGMYGMHVHEAVLKAGAKTSGCTVHFVDEAYDHGPIVSQTPVPVFALDSPQALAARVRTQEHWAYPEAVRLFCEGRLEVKDKVVSILPSPHGDSPRVRRALVSVSDKTGLLELCRGLAGLGVEIVSTSGTAKLLQESGVEVRPLDTLTGFPEILQGRVKTLHPKVHGAILLRRKDPGQAREAALFGIEPIDLVVVNLYPFAKTVSGARSPFDKEVIEQIDIGGVTLIRAAAKNFEDVAVAVSPADYPGLLSELEKGNGQLSPDTRKRLAVKAFEHTAQYDTMIFRAWSQNGSGKGSPAPGATPSSFPESYSVSLTKVQNLRYGENPHQMAALYALPGAEGFQQLHGKELSYNNLLDASGTWDAVSDFQEPACVIFKHVTPSGIATGKSATEAFDRAWACDPLSAFGGVMALNRTFPKAIAESLTNRFVEVIVAPDYEPQALALLRLKPNIRLLVRKAPPSPSLQLRSIGDLALVTEPDRAVLGPDWKVVTKRKPTPAEEKALRFAWAACKHVKSNAIVLAGAEATVGIGAGQMSRVDSVHMAGVKYKMFQKDNPAPQPLVLASDAFFPFRDGVDAAATLGPSAVIQPGGSVRDPEVIAAADEKGLAMVFTGMRHFRH